MKFKKIVSGVFGSGDLSDHYDYYQTKEELVNRGFSLEIREGYEFAKYTNGNPQSDATYVRVAK
ncbi:MAG: hypothetical protein KGJ58_04130 [Patescibacteria group bacterium]|nr:hypothetical protein [Patescibacteria group bacterium]